MTDILHISPQYYPSPQERYDRLWQKITEHPQWGEAPPDEPVPAMQARLKRIAARDKTMIEELYEFGFLGGPIRAIQWEYWRAGIMCGPWPPDKSA